MDYMYVSVIIDPIIITDHWCLAHISNDMSFFDVYESLDTSQIACLCACNSSKTDSRDRYSPGQLDLTHQP